MGANRTEEAIGSGTDIWTAFREGAFGDDTRPFVGWLIHVESAPGSSREVAVEEPHFRVFDEFRDTSYLQRYDELCRRLMREQLYTSAALVASKPNAAKSGDYTSISVATSIDAFLDTLAGHMTTLRLRAENGG